MDLKEKKSVNSLGRPLEPKSFHRSSPLVIVATGNHDAAVPELDKKLNSDTMEIFHFPLRHYRQFENKIVNGGGALIRNEELAYDIGDTWRKLHELHEKGGLPDYYATQLFTDEQIEKNIANDFFIRDTRLKDYIKGF
jgi:hypothetical protein